MNKLNNFTMYASKVIEVFFWVLLGLLTVSIILSCISVAWANTKIRENNIDVVAEIGKFVNENTDVTVGQSVFKLTGDALVEEGFLTKEGTVRLFPIIMAIIYGCFNCAAFAMIFRNIYLILKTAKGKTWFSQGETPFQKDITRMIRELGIFLIGLAVIGFIMSLFVSTVSFELLYVVIGILMLCLSSFFAYGEGLQKENDGLI